MSTEQKTIAHALDGVGYKTARLKSELRRWVPDADDSFETPVWYLQSYGYQLEGKDGTAPYACPLEKPPEGWPLPQIAKRREALPAIRTML